MKKFFKSEIKKIIKSFSCISNCFTCKAQENDILEQNITEIITTSLDPEELKNKIVKEIGISLNAYRCYFIEYDSSTNNFKKITNEYKANRNSLSMLGYEVENNTPYLSLKQKYINTIIIDDIEKFIKENKLEDTAEYNYFKKYDVKAYLSIKLEFNNYLLGVIVVQFNKSKEIFLKNFHSMFSDNIKQQLSTAIYLSKLYDKEKKEKEKEHLLRSIISFIKTGQELKQVIHKTFEIFEKIYNTGTIYLKSNTENLDDFYFNTETSQYNLKNIDILNIYELPIFMKVKNKIHYIKDTQNFVFQNNLENTPIEAHFNYYEIKSLLIHPILYEDRIKGYVFIHFNKVNLFTEGDLDFITSIINQLGIAIHQNELYKKIEKSKNREILLRTLINDIRNTLDITQIEQKTVDKTGKLLNADRCYITEFDTSSQMFLPVKIEYLKKQNYKSFKEFSPDKQVPEIAAIAKKGGELIYKDTEKFIIENNLQNSITDEFFKKNSIKSGFALPIFYSDQILGFIATHSITKKNAFNDEDIDLVRTFANQIGIALHQAKLYQDIEQRAKRETLLRRVSDAIRSSLDLNLVLELICKELIKAFNADEVAIATYENFETNKDWGILVEHSKNDIKNINFSKESFSSETIEYLGNYLLEENKEIVINNIQDSGFPKYFIEDHINLSINSVLAIGIRHGNNKLGVLGIFSTNKERTWTTEETEFLKEISEQIYLAMYQANLFSTIDKQFKRELTTKNITELVRGSLDLNEVKANIVTEIGKAIKADRCFIIMYDHKNKTFKNVDKYSEYLSDKNLKSVINREYKPEDAKLFYEIGQNETEFFIYDIDEFIQTKNYQNTFIDEYFKELNVKTNIGITIIQSNVYIGRLVIHFKNKVQLDDDDISFLRTISNQSGTAIYQAQLYEKEKQRSEQEAFLRNIISIIRSSLDINKIKEKITEQVGKILNADRVFFADYNDETKNYYVDKSSEYRSSENVKSLVDFDFISTPGFKQYVRDFHLKGNDIIFDDLDEYIKEKNLQGSEIENFYKEFGFISSMAINIYYGETFLGDLVITFEHKREIKDEEIELIKILVDQTAVAIYQAKLYETQKQTAKKEKLLRYIIGAMRSSLDINILKKHITTQMGKYFNADRCVIHQIDKNTGKFYILDETSEYLKSEDISSFDGINLETKNMKFFKELFSTKVELIIPDFIQYIDNLTELSEEQKEWTKNFEIKSNYIFPITYQNNIIARLYLNYVKEPKTLSTELLNDLRALCDQIGIALKHAELYETQKQTAEKETLLKNIIEFSRDIKDTKELKLKLICSLAKTLNADRIILNETNYENTDFIKTDDYIEFKKNQTIRSYKKFDFTQNKQLSFIKNLLLEKNEIIAPNWSEYINKMENLSQENKEYLNQYDHKSVYIFPIIYYDKVIGAINIHFIDNIKFFNPEEITFIETIIAQIGINLFKAELYSKEKTLLASIIENTDDICVIKDLNLRVLATNKAFMYAAGKNSTDEIIGKTDSEIFEVPEDQEPIRTYMNDERKAQTLKKGEYILRNEPVIYPDGRIRLFQTKKYPIYDTNNKLIATANISTDISEIERTKEEKDRFLNMILKSVEFEFNLEEIAKTVCKELAKILKVDSVEIIKFSKINSTDKFSSLYNHTNLSTAINDYKIKEKSLKKLKEQFDKNKQYICINNTNNLSIEDQNLFEYLKHIKAKSFCIMPIILEEKIWGIVIITQINTRKEWLKDEINLIETTLNQFNIAIKQSQLYEETKKRAEKEHLLREITTELRLYQSIENIINYILPKLAEILNANRVFFIENAEFKYESPIISYEHVERDLLSLKDQNELIYSSVVNNLIKKDTPTIINHFNKYKFENTKFKQFINKYKIGSIIIYPLIRYNSQKYNLGAICICSEKERNWSKDEFELIENILNIAVNNLWLIKKRTELDELRNTFILTMAHDLQVPLVGEKRALEYLNSRSGDISKYKDFIKELITSNEDTYDLLTKLIYSYNYELGKKDLKLYSFNVVSILEEVINSFNEKIKNKSLNINQDIGQNIPNAEIDYDEIKKVIHNLLENAIKYTQTNGEIKISCKQQDNYITICITDNGPGIAPDVRERIFERYAMAQAIQRKIGSGLGLYLSKQIIEAHKGQIWYKTELGKGTTFCINLPISKSL